MLEFQKHTSTIQSSSFVEKDCHLMQITKNTFTWKWKQCKLVRNFDCRWN